jgi:heme exporter protein C
MLMSVSGVLFLLKRNIYADHVNVVLAPIGMSFTFITIVTGMIWAKPMWGKWWVWDVRLTSVLVLFFFYLVYWILRKVLDETERTMVATSSLLLVGCINIPIVKFSVNFWNSIHQPTSVSLIKGSTIDKNILIPLLSMFVCAVIYSTVVFMTRLRCRLLDVGEVDG